MIGHSVHLSTYQSDPPVEKRPFNLETHRRKGLVAVRACEMDARLRYIVGSDYSARVSNTHLSRCSYRDDLPVAVPTSTCDGLCRRLVDCLDTNLPKFQNHLVLDIKKLHVGKARS